MPFRRVEISRSREKERMQQSVVRERKKGLRPFSALGVWPRRLYPILCISVALREGESKRVGEYDRVCKCETERETVRVASLLSLSLALRVWSRRLCPMPFCRVERRREREQDARESESTRYIIAPFTGVARVLNICIV